MWEENREASKQGTCISKAENIYFTFVVRMCDLPKETVDVTFKYNMYANIAANVVCPYIVSNYFTIS